MLQFFATKSMPGSFGTLFARFSDEVPRQICKFTASKIIAPIAEISFKYVVQTCMIRFLLNFTVFFVFL